MSNVSISLTPDQANWLMQTMHQIAEASSDDADSASDLETALEILALLPDHGTRPPTQGESKAAAPVRRLLEDGARQGVEVTLDFADPEEREMTVWVDDPNPDTAREKVPQGDFSRLEAYGLSLSDAVEVGEGPVEGGTAFYFDFPPQVDQGESKAATLINSLLG